MNPPYINANTLYITDLIRIRLFEDKDLRSPVVMMLESGARVTEIARHKSLIQVRTANNAIGWVRGEYLRQLPPAAVQLNRIIPKMEQMEQQLVVLNTKLAETEAAAGCTGQSLTPSPPPSNTAAQPTTTNILRGMQQLVDQNQTLRNYIGDLEQQITTLKGGNHGSASPVSYREPMTFADGMIEFYRTISHWQLWHWLLVSAILLSLVGIGGWLGAWKRHRHPLPKGDYPPRIQDPATHQASKNPDSFRRF